MKMPFAENPNFKIKPAVNSRIDSTRWVKLNEVSVAIAPGETRSPKRRLWESIKTNRPDIVRGIKAPFVSELEKQFGAMVVISEAEFDQLMNK